MLKFLRPLPSKTFIFSQIALLLVGITILLVINYFLNNRSSVISGYSPSGKPVTMAPTTLTLEITSPNEDSLTFQPSVIISGQTNPNSNVLVSSQYQNKILQSQFDGSFSTVFELETGVNQITIATFSDKGDQKSISRTVYYSEEKI